MDDALEDLLAEIAAAAEARMPAWIRDLPDEPPRRRQRVDGPRLALMLRDLEAMAARIAADRQARYERLAPRRAQAMEAYRRAQAELGRQGVTVAASAWWDPPGPVQIW